MIVQWVDTPEFKEIHKCSEESLWVFKAERAEFLSLSDFGYVCAFQKYQRGCDCLQKRNKKHRIPYNPKPWQELNISFPQKPLDKRRFWEKQNQYLDELRDPPPAVALNHICFALILCDEWNSVFIVAELTDAYIGYWWETSA